MAIFEVPRVHSQVENWILVKIFEFANPYFLDFFAKEPEQCAFRPFIVLSLPVSHVHMHLSYEVHIYGKGIKFSRKWPDPNFK